MLIIGKWERAHLVVKLTSFYDLCSHLYQSSRSFNHEFQNTVRHACVRITTWPYPLELECCASESAADIHPHPFNCSFGSPLMGIHYNALSM